jgi:hypothetical protein
MGLEISMINFTTRQIWKSVMTQTVSRRPLMADARFRLPAGPCMMCGGNGGNISFDYSSPPLPVCIVPVLHTHLFVDHRRYINLQYDSVVR